MKRGAQPPLSAEGRESLEYYAHTLQQVEDLSAVTIRNYLSDLHQFIAWCESSCWHEVQEDCSFTPQAVAPPLLIRYRAYLQTTLWLKPATVNRALMSLKRYFAWITKSGIMQFNPTSTLKFIPKEASIPRHLSDDEESALVAAVNATGTQRDQTIITLLLHTGLRAQELCTLTRQQVHPGKRNGMLRIIGKRKKVRDVPLHRLAQIMGHDSLDTTMLYIRGTKQDLQQDVEKIAWT